MLHVRFDWGETGIRAHATERTTVVVVDVLSFSTAVDVATARQVCVYPSRWDRPDTVAIARRLGAHYAVGRSSISEAEPYSLSPGSLERLPPGERLVLPSVNGGACVEVAATTGVAGIVVACLRNAAAVARYLRERSQGPIVVIAAGERWSTGEVRFAVEDYLGAGALFLALQAPEGALSPEAIVARNAFVATKHLHETLVRCVSGQELYAHGFPDDVAMAAQHNASDNVPVLDAEGFLRSAP